MLALLLVAATSPFSCVVTRVHDGDGPLWCANGVKVRIAGVQAPDFQNAEPCRRATHPAYSCDDMAAARSRGTVEKLVLGKRLSCLGVDRSYGRVVARCTLPDGRSLSCAVVAADAAVRWDRYWRQYRMNDCR
ncbi:hypothetical protein Q4F19_07905 [Sphingomonas sp. BIUV-7]|uniref:Nuclease n=1 Tax=Sphingomonas natans TaxID=3063330 RepID=A0ABT8Y7L7_9SPHN|nr:hypothetical protein [Sphingomonas sp. BIUV-7]MDO6414303.1 hypothetical protein [Sphingomonas sp. BIUV-7]